MLAKDQLCRLLVCFVFLLVLTFYPASAQVNEPVLYWVTSEGVVGTYAPATATLNEYPLSFEINTSAVQWLGNSPYFLHHADYTYYEVISAESGEVVCAIEENIDSWAFSPTQEDVLLLFRLGDGVTEVFALNWFSCQENLLAELTGDYIYSSPSSDLPLLALSTIFDSTTQFFVLDLLSGDVSSLNIESDDSPAPYAYWTEDSTHLFIEAVDAFYFYSTTAETIERFDKTSSGAEGLYPIANAPILFHSSAHDPNESASQFWEFENGQIGELLFEIEGELYDHMAGFSPDSRYYAYTTDTSSHVQVYDWQSDRLIEIPVADALRRWSPDSRRLALYQRDAEQVHVYDMETGTLDSYDGNLFWLGDDIWSPDGQMIAFWEHDDEQEFLYIINLNEDEARQIYVKAFNADFPSSVRWSPDNMAVVVHAVQMDAEGAFSSCYTLVTVVDAESNPLGCGDWSLHWTGRYRASG